MTGTRRTPGSKNVLGYYLEREARRTGILYVTFLESYRDEARSGPGPTYDLIEELSELSGIKCYYWFFRDTE